MIRKDRGSELEHLGIRFPALRKRVKQGFSFYDLPEERVLEVWEGFDLDGGVWRVRAQLPPWKRGETPRRAPLKTEGAEREIELLPEVIAMLRPHKAEMFALGRARPEDFVFQTSAGTPIHPRNLARAIRNAADKAGLNPEGVDPLSSHDLRYTAISRWIAAGLDLVVVSRLAGHADPSITARVYAGEFARRDRREEIRAKLAAGTSIRVSG